MAHTGLHVDGYLLITEGVGEAEDIDDDVRAVVQEEDNGPDAPRTDVPHAIDAWWHTRAAREGKRGGRGGTPFHDCATTDSRSRA